MIGKNRQDINQTVCFVDASANTLKKDKNITIEPNIINIHLIIVKKIDILSPIAIPF